jgi:hypothetical protein
MGPSCGLNVVEEKIPSSLMWLSGQQHVTLLTGPSWLICTCALLDTWPVIPSVRVVHPFVTHSHVIRIQSIVQCFRT